MIDILQYFDPLKIDYIMKLMENRGVEIGIEWHEDGTLWFYATNALRKNMMIVWGNKVCLSVNVNFVNLIPNRSITKCLIL